MVGVLVWVVSSGKTNTSETTIENQVETNSGVSFAEFLQQEDASYQCQVTQYLDAGLEQSTEGTVFIHQGLVRGDYTAVINGVEVRPSLVIKDSKIYTWTDFAPFGVVTPIVLDENQNTNTPQTAVYTWADKEIGAYDCVAWEVDLSKFEIPADVNFQEIAQ